MKGELYMRAVLHSMKATAQKTVIETLVKVAPLFQQLIKLNPENLEKIVTLLKYIIQTARDVSKEELNEIISKVMPHEIRETAMTLAESLIEEGKIEEKFKTAQEMFQKEMNWDLIEELTGLNQEKFQEFSKRFENEKIEENWKERRKMNLEEK